MKHRRVTAILNLAALCPSAAWSHASEQGFVLLLPTDLYTGAGVVAVALTVSVMAVLPRRSAGRLFRPIFALKTDLRILRGPVSVCATALLIWLIYVGLTGPRDPLTNPLPLAVWTVFWIGLVTLQGVFGSVWSWVNPVSTAGACLKRWRRGGTVRLPASYQQWPALLSFLLFSYILLADPAPSDPARLARLAGLYWASAFLLTLVFGPRWLIQGEIFTVLMRQYGRVALVGGRQLGLFGWQVVARRTGLSGAVLCVFLLATGSFDGLNETFWWLGGLGINPFEFPGRSAVIWHSTFGLIAANLGLLLVFSGVLILGARLTRAKLGLGALLRIFAPTLLPIALGYHVAHYLPSFLVDSQYALVALSDPFLTGADYLGLGEFYVTTGFFNTQDSVRRIYLTQAGAIVLGHIVAVLTAHALALRAYASHREAVLAQAPLAAFMVAYTWFGLWLLASPRF